MPLTSLPQYWAPRGVVLAAKVDRGEAGKNTLPVPVIYRGEPLWGANYDTYLSTGPAQASNVSVLGMSYYPAITANPIRFERIAFARGAANKVPATYENIVTQPLILDSGLLGNYPIWDFFLAKGFGARHAMSPRALWLY